MRLSFKEDKVMEPIKSTYEAWVMMDDQCMVISEEEYKTPQELIEAMLQKGYTIEGMKENNFTCTKVLSDGECWLEALEDYDYTENNDSDMGKNELEL